MNDANVSHLDRELALLAAEIDKLALADLPARIGLEDRIFAATLPVLQNAPQVAQLRLTGEETSSRHVAFKVRFSTPMRVAAGFALLVTGTAVWLGNSHPHGPSPKAVAVVSPSEDWAVVTAMFDDKASKELSDLLSATAGLDEKAQSFDSDLLLEEGSM